MSEEVVASAILLVALALFVSERVRHDLVALIALFACIVTGLVGPREALLGFADPAVVAVAAVLVVGRAIELTGVAGAVTGLAVPRTAGFAVRLAALMTVGALLSAFMNNIAALVITMPLAAEIARKAKLAPGAVLMPLAFATILGGMTTLIGTPANLILSSIREEELGEPLSFFAMTEVGVAVAAIGLLYLATLGWRLIPARRAAERAVRPWRVYELCWPAGRTGTSRIHAALRAAGARLLGAFRDGRRLPPGESPQAGDRLLLLSRNSQWDVAEEAGLDPSAAMVGVPGSVTARVVVAHGSLLIGEGYEAVRTRSGGVRVVAGGPRPARLRQPLDTIRIEAGDQLFIRGLPGDIAGLVAKARLLEVDRFDPAPLDRRRGALTIAIFVAAVAAAVTGLASPAVAFLGAAGAVAALRLIPADEVYRSIDWTVVLLLAAMLPVGRAFEQSGAADMAASWLGEALAGAPIFWTLAALCSGTLLLSIFLNNVATAVIMGPIAIQLARLLGIDPDAALLAVLVGASSDFLTPIGHQNNLLVMGPGGYRFTDYARVGAVLAALTILTAAGVLSASVPG
ncbi:MAG TPA: SLC13 family permease [Allosphingosinicella sp.]|nr:SLC13 family permease [Allosphingosinicella sp.]